MKPRPIVIFYGAGLDSWVMLLIAVFWQVPVAAVVFADTGDPEGEDPGEWPATYHHLRSVVMPFCEKHGIRFEWLDKARYPVRGEKSLFAWMWKKGQIPVAGPDRLCTTIAKVEPCEAWLDANFPGRTVDVWVGFEAGEESRAENDPNAGRARVVKRHQLPRGRVHLNLLPKVRRRLPVRIDLRQKPARRFNVYVLMQWGLCRCLALAIARASGLPVPPGSACVYCPYGTRGDWQLFARLEPRKFEMVVQLEARKAPTAAGFKLSIMDFKKVKDASGKVLRYRAPKLPDFIAKPYKARLAPCGVCGAAVKVRKGVGCGFNAEVEAVRLRRARTAA